MRAASGQAQFLKEGPAYWISVVLLQELASAEFAGESFLVRAMSKDAGLGLLCFLFPAPSDRIPVSAPFH